MSAFFCWTNFIHDYLRIFAKNYNLISLPVEFEKRINESQFWDNNLLENLNTVAPVSVRINPSKVRADLSISHPVSWSRSGYYLTERPVFTLDPLFHAGCYYPQEAGSMFIEYILDQLNISRSSAFLDLCAAPGGKSTLVSSWIDKTGFLVSNEIIPSRNVILRENISKWGSVNVVVTGNQPKDFQRLPSFFDVILVDAPCSGEGMFRKDPNSRLEWSVSNVHMCADRQREIVEDVWDSLKPGGFLIYSTCTLNQFENEDNVRWICDNLDAEICEIKLPESVISGMDGIGSYFAPGHTESEGFFCAILRKCSYSHSKIKTKLRLKKLSHSSINHMNEYVDLTDLQIFEYKDSISACFDWHSHNIDVVFSTLNCTKLGVELGIPFPKKFEPSQELALSSLINEEVVKNELSKEQALSYLKGETFSIDTTKKGFQLVSYKNQSLGWINHLGNRFNNMYPKEWRIRMKIN